MIILPSCVSKTLPRPGHVRFEEAYLVPNSRDFQDFWGMVYSMLFVLKVASPVRRSIGQYINPKFGYFGYRVHPVTREPRYFHAGISLELKQGRNIYPILPGVLEYSGYGATNGYYVLLSHPNIRTEDGYVLHSMYCHLKKPLVKFNSYQKMLREISLGSYPEVPVSIQTVLGTASISGLSRKNHPGMYLQLSLRKFDEKPIVLDPFLFYEATPRENTSATITNERDIEKLFIKKTPAKKK